MNVTGLLNTLHVCYIYNTNNLHPFSIFYNTFIFIFLSLRESKSALPENIPYLLSTLYIINDMVRIYI